MNMRREAFLWSIAMITAIVLGLMVVCGATMLAFGRPAAVPLYFVAAQYRQDDYSADAITGLRLSPLDAALEQEAILEDQARVTADPTPDYYNNPTATRSVPTNRPTFAPSLTSLPTQSNTPGATSTRTHATSVPTATNTLNVPNTQKPPNTQKTPPPKPPRPPKPPKPAKGAGLAELAAVYWQSGCISLFSMMSAWFFFV